MAEFPLRGRHYDMIISYEVPSFQFSRVTAGGGGWNEDFIREFNLNCYLVQKKRDEVKKPLSKWQVLFEAEMKAKGSK